MNQPEPARFEPVEANLREFFRVIARSQTGGEVREAGGLTLASTGTELALFNAAFLSGPPAPGELARRLALASVHYRARALPWSFWLCEGWLDDRTRREFRALCRENALAAAAELPGMAAVSLPPPARPVPQLDCRRVEDETVRTAFCHVNAVVFRMSFAAALRIYGRESLWNGPLAGWVGYERGEPVAAATTLAAAGAAGLYCVGVIPEKRNMGYGEAITRHALDAARREYGAELLVLESTRSGYSLYQRLGFREVTRMSIFTAQ